MSRASLVGGLLAVLFVSGRLAAADGPPDVRTVVVPQARVWCGPSTSDNLYPTNELHQGDRVQVMQELDSGWLAIRPPAGSFSWINERFVQQKFPNYPGTYVVTSSEHPAPVLIGSGLKRDRPTKFGVQLERGAQVRLVGHIMTDSEGKWLPIEAPEGELRYIRKEDVSASITVVTSAASVRKTPIEPPPPPDGDRLWRDAERAERKGRLADAIRLYRQAGDANLSVNPARAEAAYQRAHFLEQAGFNSSGGSQFAPDRNAQAALVPANQAGMNAVHLIGTAASGPPTGQLVAAHGVTSDLMAPRTNDYIQGELCNASRSVNGQLVYLVVGTNDTPLAYVTAGPGIELTSHIHQKVELWGSSVFIKELRHRLLTVTHIR